MEGAVGGAVYFDPTVNTPCLIRSIDTNGDTLVTAMRWLFHSCTAAGAVICGIA